jgi:hypothetical protein
MVKEGMFFSGSVRHGFCPLQYTRVGGAEMEFPLRGAIPGAVDFAARFAYPDPAFLGTLPTESAPQ